MIIQPPGMSPSFETSQDEPLVFTLKERDSKLRQLEGKRLCMEYQENTDGTQTANRLLRETLSTFGLVFTALGEPTHAYLWIQEGSYRTRFAFVIADPSDPKHYLAYECVPNVLTASIMKSIHDFFYVYDLKREQSYPKKLESLVKSIDTIKSEALPTIEKEILEFGDQAIDMLLAAVDECNRKITTANLAQKGMEVGGWMEALERRIRLLGKTKSLRAVPAILDALADSAITVASLKQQIDALSEYADPMYMHNMMALGMSPMDQLSVAKLLNKCSITALAEVGEPALAEIREYLDSPSPAVQRSARKALNRIEKKWWQIWR